ncbi:MAG: hypothetical protein ACOZBL_01080 [Patescibacteria group bacterium]
MRTATIYGDVPAFPVYTVGCELGSGWCPEEGNWPSAWEHALVIDTDIQLQVVVRVFAADLQETRNFERERQFKLLREKIEGYLELPDDWDCSNGKAPSVTTVADSIILLNLINRNVEIPFPHISVAGDDEICFEWRKKGNSFYMFCRGKRNFNIMFKINGHRDFFGAILLSPDGIPQKYIKILSQVLSDAR